MIRPLLVWWMMLPEKMRFIVVGGFNTAVNYGLFVLLLWIVGQGGQQVALVMAWVVSSFSSFFMQKMLVFNSRANWVREYIKCAGVWMLGYVGNIFLLQIMIDGGIHIYIAQAIALLVIAIFTFILLKYIAFKNGGKNA